MMVILFRNVETRERTFNNYNKKLDGKIFKSTVERYKNVVK